MSPCQSSSLYSIVLYQPVNSVWAMSQPSLTTCWVASGAMSWTLRTPSACAGKLPHRTPISSTTSGRASSTVPRPGSSRFGACFEHNFQIFNSFFYSYFVFILLLISHASSTDPHVSFTPDPIILNLNLHSKFIDLF